MSQAQIYQLVILFFPIVCGLVAAGVRFGISKLPETQQTRAQSIVTLVVHSVEQSASTLSGPQKKAQAVRDIESILNALKISIPNTLIDTLIEAAVFALNQIQTTGNVVPAPAQIDWPADALQAIKIMTGATTTGNTSPIPVVAAAAATVSDGSNEDTAVRPVVVVQPA